MLLAEIWMTKDHELFKEVQYEKQIIYKYINKMMQEEKKVIKRKSLNL